MEDRMTDNEINEAVARKLGYLWEKSDVMNATKDFCHDIKAAWEVVNHLKDRQLCIQINIATNESKVGAWIGDAYKQICFGDAATAPMAICLAFLKLP